MTSYETCSRPHTDITRLRIRDVDAGADAYGNALQDARRIAPRAPEPQKKIKFNMLMCWCIGRAANDIAEFHMLPVDGRLMLYDTIAVNTIVANRQGEVSSCDIPFSNDLRRFNDDYLRLTRQVAETCANHDLAESMVIGTSALTQCEIDGAVGMYSGIFNNPFLIWGRYRRRLFRTTLRISFQFHHTQMDGAHAARFLNALQKEIDTLTV